MMKVKAMAVTLVLAAVLAITGEAWAQLFGDRSVGSSLSRRDRPGASGQAATGSTDVGSVTGNERFQRGRRQRGDVVGTDSRDRRSFVGAEQGTTSGEVQTAQEGMQVEKTVDANIGQAKSAPPRIGMYNPRLRIDFQFTRPSSRTRGSALVQRLESSPGLSLSSPIEVSVEGETATLRGEVASERDRTLARLLLLFEPGISEVRNELIVRSRPAAAAQNPPASRASHRGDLRSMPSRMGGPGPREF